jgi:hypothetical protein
MQKWLKIKILTTISLAILSVILLFIYSSVKKEVEEEEKKNKISSITSDQLKKLASTEIDSILVDFGIKEEWIIEQLEKDTNKKQSPGKLWFFKKVIMPRDISPSELLLEINEFLNAIKFSTVVNENPKTRDLLMDIYYAEDTLEILAKINFLYSNEIKRDAADVCIILNGLQNLPDEELEKILDTPESFSLILPFEIEETDIQSVIFDSGKEYLLMFDIGSEDDIDADFRSNLKVEDWKSKVRSFCYEYDKAGGVLLTIRSEQYKFENDVKEEFRKYRNNVFRDTVFIKFDSEEEGKKKIVNLFDDIKLRTRTGKRSLIYLVNFSLEDLQNFSKYVFELEKKGFKFMTFGNIIKNRILNKKAVGQSLK